MEEEWIVLERDFPTQDKALKAAGIIEIAEGRLSSNPKGPRYDIETETFETEAGWRVKWRKILAGYNSGCSNCGSCGEQAPVKTNNKLGKVIEFKRPGQESN